MDRLGIPFPRDSGVIRWHKVPSVPGPHLIKLLLWLILNSLWRIWDRRVHGLRCDLVLSPGVNCLDADVVIVHAAFHRLRELAHCDEHMGSHLGPLRRLHRLSYYAFLSSLERRIYTSPRVFLAAVSQRTAGLLNNYFQRRDVQIIPNGVDTGQFSPSARLALRADARLRRHFADSDFALLLIGNDWRVKGLETVLRATAALRDMPIHILVAGDDSPDFFRESARQLGILDRCHFEQPRQDVLDFYAAADLYVSPSQEDSFGLPVAEAMACGLPVITSVRAGVADLLQGGEDGFVLGDPCDFQELARLVGELFRDSPRRQRVGEAAANKALQWSWDRNAEAVWRLLQSAARRKQGDALEAGR